MGRRRRNQSKFTDNEILQNFVMDKPDKSVFGNYRIEDDKLIYRAQSSVDAPSWYDEDGFRDAVKQLGKRIAELDGKLVDDCQRVMMVEALTVKTNLHGAKIVYFETDLIAQKVKTDKGVVFLGNSDILPLVGRTVAYGRVTENRSETDIQRVMKSRGFVMLPMSAFVSADFSTYQSIEDGATLHYQEDQYNWRNDKGSAVARTFGGAKLFKLDGKTYLFDIDRDQVNRHHTNIFLTELPTSVGSIADAYESLKPKAVLDAEAKGSNVRRHGPVFFIPVDAPIIPYLTIEEKLTVLGAEATHLESQILNALIGKPVDKNAAQELLKKIPQKMCLGEVLPEAKFSRSIEIDTVIKIKDTVYCRGTVASSEGRGTIRLNEWHTPVLALGRTVKRGV
jgi:hypothetical protein